MRAMNFNVMPNAGGWYDQHPKLVADWKYILFRQAEYDDEREAQRRPTPRR